MRHPVRFLSLVVLAMVLTAACGGDDPVTPATTAPTTPSVAPSPSPTVSEAAEPVEFTTGTADFTITGDENVTINALLDTAQFNAYDPEDQEADLEFLGGDDGLLRMTLTFEGETLSDAFIAIGLGGSTVGDENYYYDAFHGQCEVTTDPFDGVEINGSFTCDDLPEENEETIDVEGTFSVQA